MSLLPGTVPQSRSNSPAIVTASEHNIAEVQKLWREYWHSLGLASDFQNFADELRTLPGVYTPPRGQLLLAVYGGENVGTAALRPIRDKACEAKRLYVRPTHRGLGIGKFLLQSLIEEARRIGYHQIFADTLRSMSDALGMYRAMGFTEVAPYATTPTPDAIFLRLSLSEGGDASYRSERG